MPLSSEQMVCAWALGCALAMDGSSAEDLTATLDQDLQDELDLERFAGEGGN